MKKLTFIAFLCLTAVSGSAQLRVTSNGKISYNTQLTPLSPISLNCDGDSIYLISAKNTNGGGVKINLSNSVEYRRTIGNYINATTSTRCNLIGSEILSQGSVLTGGCGTYGVIASADTGARAIAVLGKVGSCSRGAAIFGTTNGNTGTSIPSGQVYAGFFDGNVGINANLTVNGTINGLILGPSSNINCSQNNSSLSDNALCSLSEKLYELKVMSYKKEIDRAEQEKFMDEDSTIICYTQEQSPIEKQNYEKTHYALSAEQLEMVFPDLVYENEDGSKVINYIEMIPLLVQTINELQGRISYLEGEKEEECTKSRQLSNTSVISNTTTIPATATLVQNTPNPFTERTTIRFTLPEDAKNASICIFDMSGKMLKQVPIDATMQSITIEGYELQAGMYIYSLLIDGKEVKTRRMILSK